MVSMGIVLKRILPSNRDFRNLVNMLNSELAFYNGEDNDFYMQYNLIKDLHHAVVAYYKGEPAGCGAIRRYSAETAEIKRMYVKDDARGKGIGRKILLELESWAKELGYKYTILETGNFLKAAVGLYSANGYEIIPNYGQYAGMEKSICFKKGI
jgi:putative acetyltransferase